MTAANTSFAPSEARAETHGEKRLAPLVLGALGVVFGDIGTSPLYTLRECMTAISHQTGAPATGDDVLGVLSLIFWSLTMVVSVKYLMFIMRANNRGEGGILALLALLPQRGAGTAHAAPLSTAGVLVVIGAAFLYGDGAITPAISVLSAVEGIAVAQPALHHLVLPAAVGILIALFSIQSRGTGVIGVLFGPVMVVWFSTLALLGAIQLVQNPAVLAAVSPHHALGYFARHGASGVHILGSVVLAVTGGEALYADMGHFGRKPITRGWLLFVMPALLLAYFGQGALILRSPETAANPFFLMVPPGALTWALVVLASVATVIASQALISGSFSLTRQAIQLGLFPRVTIRHTAAKEEGQIYIPEVNALLAVACILLVLMFRESSGLAAAYGIAVTCTMTITSIVFGLVTVRVWGWPRWRALALVALFLSFDLPFMFANLFKVADGGWMPILLGAFLVLTMLVWHQGRRLVARTYLSRYPKLGDAWAVLSKRIVTRTPGVAVFMASADEGVPPFLVHHVERTRALQQRVLLLTVVTKDVPRVELKDRLEIRELEHGFVRVHVYFGYFEEPDIPRALRLAVARRELDLELSEITYYRARERILGNPGGQMNWVLERFFGYLSRNAVNADRHFRIPHGQVIEVGVQLDL